MMPPGFELTEPEPAGPARDTASWYCLSVKTALTVVGPATVMTQVPVPLQPAPDQPTNVEPSDPAAVRVTRVPAGNGAVQVSPEFEDCRRVATEKGVALKDVFAAVHAAIEKYRKESERNNG